MKVELDDAGSVNVQVPLQINDRTVTIMPNRLFIEQRVRQPFTAKNLRMDPDDQHLLVIGSVEYTDPPALR